MMSDEERQKCWKTVPRVKFICGRGFDYCDDNIRIGFMWGRIPYSRFIGRVIQVYEKRFLITFFLPKLDMKLK